MTATEAPVFSPSGFSAAPATLLHQLSRDLRGGFFAERVGEFQQTSAADHGTQSFRVKVECQFANFSIFHG